jgi:hypothetical protein
VAGHHSTPQTSERLAPRFLVSASYIACVVLVWWVSLGHLPQFGSALITREDERGSVADTRLFLEIAHAVSDFGLSVFLH